MNTVQSGGIVSGSVADRVPVPIDFSLVCLWATLGLVLTALVFTLGFGAEVGQVMAVAG